MKKKNKKTKKSSKKLIKKIKKHIRPGKKIKKLKKTKKVKKIGRKSKGKQVGGKKSPISESGVLALIEKGKSRGFVTQAEVLNSFPSIEKDIKGLEALYERLESANINIIESGRVFEEEKVKEYDEKKKIETEFGDVASDSVQMYLKEIGRYPLLT